MKRKIKEGETCQTIYVPENEIPSVIWANIFCANTKNFQKIKNFSKNVFTNSKKKCYINNIE